MTYLVIVVAHGKRTVKRVTLEPRACSSCGAEIGIERHGLECGK